MTDCLAVEWDRWLMGMNKHQWIMFLTHLPVSLINVSIFSKIKLYEFINSK